MHAYVTWIGSILLWPIAPGGVCDIFVPVPAISRHRLGRYVCLFGLSSGAFSE